MWLGTDIPRRLDTAATNGQHLPTRTTLVLTTFRTETACRAISALQSGYPQPPHPPPTTITSQANSMRAYPPPGLRLANCGDFELRGVQET
jgi:hypothetical protein